MKTIYNILIVLSMLFAFIFSQKICVAQFVSDVKQENKTDQDNQPKTYTGLKLYKVSVKNSF
jgi:hypothetical protein